MKCVRLQFATVLFRIAQESRKNIAPLSMGLYGDGFVCAFFALICQRIGKTSDPAESLRIHRIETKTKAIISLFTHCISLSRKNCRIFPPLLIAQFAHSECRRQLIARPFHVIVRHRQPMFRTECAPHYIFAIVISSK